MTITSFGDRLLQTSLTTGTGNITLVTAALGYDDISEEYAQDVDFAYVLEGRDSDGNLTGEWEDGRGHLNAGGLLIRERCDRSSTGTFVSFTSAYLNVWVDMTAAGMDEYWDARLDSKGAANRIPFYNAAVGYTTDVDLWFDSVNTRFSIGMGSGAVATCDINNGVGTDPIFIGRDGGTEVYRLSLTGEIVCAPTAGHAEHAMSIVGDTLASGKRAISVTGTLASGGSQIGAEVAITGSGTAGQYAIRVNLLAGNTGSSTIAINSNNSSTGTGADPITNDAGNFGSYIVANGTTASGWNVGSMGWGHSGLASVGLLGKAGRVYFGGTDPASVATIGVMGLGNNNGATPAAQVGVYAGLDAATPTLTSAGLIADNGGTTSPIAILRDNGSSKWTWIDGGHLTIADAVDIAVNTGTGTKIGTATNQKLGFFNATPVVQQTGVADATGGVVVDIEARAALNAVITSLEALGLLATV